MSQRETGSKKKREIALVITSFLDAGRRYSAKAIEQLIIENVRPSVLKECGLAADHIRRAMIENGYVQRDARTNETWVATDFVGISEVQRPRIAELQQQLNSVPNREDVVRNAVWN